MQWYEKTAIILANIGAINWGLTALLGWNAVESLIGSWAGTMVENIVYTLVAIGGIWGLVLMFRD